MIGHRSIPGSIRARAIRSNEPTEQENTKQANFEQPHGESMGCSSGSVPRNARLDKTRRIAPRVCKPPSPKCRRPTGAARATTIEGLENTERQNYQTNPISHNPHRFSTLLPSRRCRASSRADDKRRQQLLELVRENYSGEPQECFGPTLAAQHRAADQGIAVPRSLRRWMLAAGLWSRRGKRKPHRSRCQRRAHCGALVQLDGSHHDWLAGRGAQGCLLNFVGDATGLAPCRFASEETTWAAADLRAAWVRQHGLPKALYCDWKNVYKRQPTSREAIEGSEPETHFGGLCAKLDMRIMAPSSPPAKGRVERHHATHQDHLSKKMRLAGIAPMPSRSNEWLRGRASRRRSTPGGSRS